MSDKVREDACKKASAYKIFAELSKSFNIPLFASRLKEVHEFEKHVSEEYDKMCKSEDKINLSVYNRFENDVKSAEHHRLYENRPTVEKATKEDHSRAFERLIEWNKKFPPTF